MIPPLGVTAPLVLYHTGSGRLQGDKAKEAPSREQGRNCLGQSRERWLGAQRWVLVFECYLPATPLALSGKTRVGDTPCWHSACSSSLQPRCPQLYCLPIIPTTSPAKSEQGDGHEQGGVWETLFPCFLGAIHPQGQHRRRQRSQPGERPRPRHSLPRGSHPQRAQEFHES